MWYATISNQDAINEMTKLNSPATEAGRPPPRVSVCAVARAFQRRYVFLICFESAVRHWTWATLKVWEAGWVML